MLYVHTIYPSVVKYAKMWTMISQVLIQKLVADSTKDKIIVVNSKHYVV